MPIKLTEANLRQLFPRARQGYINALINEQEFLARHGLLDTPLRWCHFCAQIGAETDGLRIVRESLYYTTRSQLLKIFGSRHSAKVRPWEASKLLRNEQALGRRVYGKGNPSMARRLGNTQEGDGYDFRGAGPGQVTGRGQWTQYASDLGLDIAARPVLLNDPVVGLKAFVLEWEHRGLNAYADRNQGDMVLKISKGVNLGNPNHKATPNGLADRRAWYRKAWSLWRDADAAENVSAIERKTNWLVLRIGDDSTEVKAMQERLVSLGYHLGMVDGIFGTETQRQVRAFQGDHQLVADGIVGPNTWQALRTAEEIDRGGRQEITADELAERGSRTVAVARKVKRKGMFAFFGGAGGLGAAFTIPKTIAEIPGWIENVRTNGDAWSSAISWLCTPAGLVTLGATVLVIYGTRLFMDGQAAEDARVNDARTGANLAR